MSKKKICIIVCLAILVIVALGAVKYFYNGNDLVVLMYHNIIPESEIIENNEDRGYSISLEEFEKQLKYLKENNYENVDYEKFICWKKGKCKIDKKSVMITIDDGLTSSLNYAKDVLEKYGYTSIVFVIGDRILEEENLSGIKGRNFLNINQIKNNNVIFFGSHSYGLHKFDESGTPYALVLKYEELENDIIQNKKIINTNFYSYPFGTFNKGLVKTLKKHGYEYAFRTGEKKTYKYENNYMIHRISATRDFNDFKSIFETNKYSQKFIDRLKNIYFYFKY